MIDLRPWDELRELDPAIIQIQTTAKRQEDITGQQQLVFLIGNGSYMIVILHMCRRPHPMPEVDRGQEEWANAVQGFPKRVAL